MFAETVYSVYNSLSQIEKDRFIDIIQKEAQPKKVKQKKESKVKSKEEYLDIALKNMSSKQKRS
jgi:hypothetical protein